MKCPNCEHTSTIALLRCSKCGEVYEREPLARYEHLQFFLQWLDENPDLLSKRATLLLRMGIAKQIDEVRAVLIPPPPPVEVAPPITPPIVVQPPPPLQIVVPPPPVTSPAPPKPITLPPPVSAPVTPKPITPPLTVSQSFTSPATPKSITPTPPKPAAPPIEWGKVWERAWGFVVSGALLRGLLYLGAFMIVVSAVVLVTVYWNNFPLLIQIGFIIAIPLLFYAGGFAVRELLKIPVAGGVLTGIGALLIAVDFAAVYQLARITLEVNLYWFIGALVCLVIYTFTAWRIRGQFFNYLSLIALSNMLFAFTRAIRLPLEWQIASVTASAGLMVGAAIVLRGEAWREFSDSARRLPIILLPASLFFILFVPGQAAFGQMTAFGLACVGYALLAWRFPHALHMHGATWSFLIAVEFALRGFDVRYEWHPTVAAMLAGVYLTAGKIFTGRLPESFKPRRNYALAIYIAGFGLAIMAVSGGFISLIVSLWACVAALALTSLVLAWSAYLFRRATFVFLAAALFIAPFTLAWAQWFTDFKVLQWVAWLALAWSALSLVYLLIAAVLRQAEHYAMSLNVWAQALLPLSLFGLFVSYLFTIRNWFALPTLIALGGVIAAYLASAIIHDSERHPALSKLISWLPPFISRPIFLIVAAGLLPLWVGIAWWGSVLKHEWFGAGLAVLALLYVGGGQLLMRRRSEYRLPLHVLAGVLSLLSIPFAWGEIWALITALSVMVLTLLAFMVVYRRVLFLFLAAGLFIVPFTLALDQWFTTYAVFQAGAWLMFAWSLLAVVYLLIAVALRTRERYAMSLNVWAQALLPLSLFGLFVNYLFTIRDWFALPTLFALGGVISAYVVSAIIHDSEQHPALSKFVSWLPPFISRPIFLIVAAGLLPLWVGIAWWGSVLKHEWFGVGLAALALAYVGGGQLLVRRRSEYRLPLHVLAGVLSLLSIPFAWGEIWALITALSVMVLTLLAFMVVYRRVLFLFLAAGLFIVPFTLALDQWFTTYAVFQAGAWLMFAWSLLAVVYLLIAVALRTRERYAMSLNVWAQALLPLSLFGLFVNYLFTIRDWFALPTLIALGGVIAAYVVSAIIHDSERHPALSKFVSRLPLFISRPIFLIPLGFLIPLWVAIAWWNSILDRNWLGVALVVNALVFVGVGQLLARRRSEYRWLVHAFVYPISVASMAFALRAQLPLTVTLYVGVINLIVLAVVYKRVIEIAAAALLILIPFYLTLDLVHLDPQLYPLAFVLLASVLYVPLGVALDRAGRKYALPPYVVGYAVSAVAVTVSSIDNLWTLSWLGVVVPLIACVLYIFSVYRFKRIPFAAAAVIVFSLGYFFAFAFLKFDTNYTATAWVLLAFAYMLGERALNWLNDRHTLTSPDIKAWWALFRWPLTVAAVAFCALIFSLSLPVAVSVFINGRFDNAEQATQILSAQTLIVLFTIVAAWLYHRSAPLYFEPFLAFFPVMLFFLEYSDRLFGQALKPSQLSIVWAVLGAVHVVAAALIDVNPRRYARGLYLGGYAFAVLAVLWKNDPFSNLVALGLAILLAVFSQVLVHFNLHRTFREFVAKVSPKNDSLGRSLFLFIAVYAFPVWLTQLAIQLTTPFAWRGLWLAALAPIYVALGVGLKRARDEYKRPFYSAGYALTVIGAGVASGDRLALIYTLTIAALLYAASAYLFKRAFWLYLSNALVPLIILLTLDYSHTLTAHWVSRLFAGLAFIYFLVGYIFFRRKGQAEKVGRYALPFLISTYALSVIVLFTSLTDKYLTIEIYLEIVVLCALSAWLLRQKWFLYPTAWLVVVPYYLALTLTALEVKWYGVSWTSLIVVYMAIGYLGFNGKRLKMREWLTHAATPFYVMAYALSLWMILSSRGEALTFTVALAAGAVIYFASAVMFESNLWLYPALAATHLSIVSYFAIRPSDQPSYYVSLPFTFVTWAMGLLGYGLSRRTPAKETKIKSPFINHLSTPAWPQPFLIFTILDVIFWQWVALNGFETGILLAVSNTLLLGLLATLWGDALLAYGALIFFALAGIQRLRWTSLPIAEMLAWISGIGFGLYLARWMIEAVSTTIKRLAVWLTPLARASAVISLLALLSTLPFVAAYTTASAATLTFAGALYLTMANRARNYRLGYVGLALLEVAFVLLLIKSEVREMQVYALPTGLYFTVVGFFERRLRKGLFAVAIETFGLAVMLLTALIQSFDAATGFPYFILLLAEGLLVIWWGAARRFKLPFFMGISASVINVTAQIILLVNWLQLTQGFGRFVIIFVVGVVLVIVAIFVERQRTRILTKAKEWREALEIWE